MQFGFKSISSAALRELWTIGVHDPRQEGNIETDLSWESDFDGGWLYTLPGEWEPSLWADQDGNLHYIKLPRHIRERPRGHRSLLGTGPESGVYIY